MTSLPLNISTPLVPGQCHVLIGRLHNIILRPHRLQAGGAQAIRELLADLVQMLGRQLHRLALAQQDRAGLAFKQRLAAGSAFLFVFAHLY
ncbi:MAG: hypothetical protein P8047_05185 [Gammaproteobacteria bacterium]